MRPPRWAARAAAMIGRPLCGFSAVNQICTKGMEPHAYPCPPAAPAGRVRPPQCESGMPLRRGVLQREVWGRLL
jgi:hypothetical protein